MAFQRATKHQARLRMAAIGPSGSGKTMWALKLATGLSDKVALIDTERASASHYADRFQFDTCVLDTYSPDAYMAAIREAEQAGYEVLIIDSLSHAWAGKDGILEFVDKAAKRSQSGSSFHAWRDATPLHNRLVDTIIGCRCHIIATMRAKTDYVQEQDERGKTRIRKLGLQPVQRDGLEYEFDVVADITPEHNLLISKTRCDALSDRDFSKDQVAEVASILKQWLTAGTPEPPKPAPVPQLPDDAPPAYDASPPPAEVPADGFVDLDQMPTKRDGTRYDKPELIDRIHEWQQKCEKAGINYPSYPGSQQPMAMEPLALMNYGRRLRWLYEQAQQGGK